VFLCLRYEIPLLLRQGGGAIVNTSSSAGVKGFPGEASYVAAKHGVVGLTCRTAPSTDLVSRASRVCMRGRERRSGRADRRRRGSHRWITHLRAVGVNDADLPDIAGQLLATMHAR
jgi:NAD(P)-dependent dehydrogenase (short-subunit alcohol dehydrogenase family)